MDTPLTPQSALTLNPPMAAQNRSIAEAVAHERGRLGSFIRQRVPDPGDAEDILQDVFFALALDELPARQRYWQALGIVLLSRILFGGLRGNSRGDWRTYSKGRESMTPEEREQLKSRFRSRWSCWIGPDKRDNETPKDTATRPD